MVDGGRQVGVYVDREARRVDKNEEGRGKKRKEKKKDGGSESCQVIGRGKYRG